MCYQWSYISFALSRRYIHRSKPLSSPCVQMSCHLMVPNHQQAQCWSRLDISKNFLLARLPKFYINQYLLYMDYKTTLQNSTCPTGSGICPALLTTKIAMFSSRCHCLIMIRIFWEFLQHLYHNELSNGLVLNREQANDGTIYNMITDLHGQCVRKKITKHKIT